MVLLRKLRVDPLFFLPRLVGITLERVHQRVIYPRVLLGMLFLVLLVVILTAYPVQSSQPPYLTYPSTAGQTFQVHPVAAGSVATGPQLQSQAIPITGR